VGLLPVAVAAGLEVRTGATVRALRRTPRGFALVVGPTTVAEEVEADEVVLATPGAPTARLLAGVAPAAAAELAAVEYASMAIVTLAFRAQDVAGLTGSGFLVPPVEGRVIKASTFSFNKWDWVRAAGVGPEDEIVVMRCSLGRHREEQALQRTDEELVEIALHDLADAIGLSVRPVDSHVQRWGGALPQYAVGHLDRVASVRRELETLSGLAVCGSAYDGVGIPACIASAEMAAAKVVHDLATMEP
jgi:oxygen-dependent protoporphyrinogen oxidase